MGSNIRINLPRKSPPQTGLYSEYSQKAKPGEVSTPTHSMLPSSVYSFQIGTRSFTDQPQLAGIKCTLR